MEFELGKLGALISFNMIATVAIGLISLFIGQKIKDKVLFFQKIGVPAVVIGGLLFAVIHLVLRSAELATITYNTTLLTPFMLVFFTIIGLSSSIEGLKQGGKLLIFFWLLSGIMTFMQTTIGVSLAKITDLNPLLGVMAGSVSMSGGHGSAAAFGQTIEELGVQGGLSVALSSATFGLVAGALLGAPLAIHLIKKYKLKPKETIEQTKTDDEVNSLTITLDSMMSHIVMLSIVIGIGMSLATLFRNLFDLALPSYVGAMLVAIIFNNLNIKYKWIELNRNFLSILAEAALTIFLSMALISLKLWELASLALPLFTILIAQVIFMYLYTRYIVFRIMGKDYDAAVMVAGMCGSGMGATTNAMLNMGEVSKKYGYTFNPYLIVPLTGAFLIDIFQMPVILTAINLFK